MRTYAVGPATSQLNSHPESTLCGPFLKKYRPSRNCSLKVETYNVARFHFATRMPCITPVMLNNNDEKNVVLTAFSTLVVDVPSVI